MEAFFDQKVVFFNSPSGKKRKIYIEQIFRKGRQ